MSPEVLVSMPSITMISGRSLRELAVLRGRIGQELTGSRTRTDTLGVVSRIAAEWVPGAAWASVTECRKDRFATVAATGDAARTLDAIQYDAGSGPCVDAIRRDTHCRSGDLSGDGGGRWSCGAPPAPRGSTASCPCAAGRG